MDDKIELILNESRIIENVCNENFLEKFAELHNIPKEFNKFSVKQEVIAQKGYFLDVKKHYGLWIVNKEGVPVSKYDIKGLITQRSDYPDFTKKKITELLDLLLKEQKVSFTNIRKKIEEAEEKINDKILNGEKDIARPVSFTKELSSYKKIPSHIISMQFWNDIEYEYFFPGTKGYLFNILGIDEYKAPEKVKRNLANKYLGKKIPDRIVLPYEEDKLPDYYNIDTTAMLEFSWRNRVSELLKPLWEKIYRKNLAISLTTF